jgi:hypothetical protein
LYKRDVTYKQDNTLRLWPDSHESPFNRASK